MLQKAAVVVIGLGVIGVAAIFLDVIVNGKEILKIATTIPSYADALKPMKKRVHDIGPYFK